MPSKRKPIKTFLRVEREAQAIDMALGRVASARVDFEKSRTQIALEGGAVLAAAQAKLSRYGDGVFIRWATWLERSRKARPSRRNAEAATNTNIG